MKHNIKRLLSMLLVVCMVLGMFPVTAFAAEYPVANTADLTAALTSAGDGDTIKLTGDITDADITGKPANSGVFVIDKALTIDGNGHTITASGSGDTQMFVINAAGKTVTLKNLTINGASKTRNGIMAYTGTTVNLEDVTVTGNNWYGVVVNGATVNANNLVATGNTWGVNVDAKGSGAGFVLDGTSNIAGGVIMESDAGQTAEVSVKAGAVDTIVSHPTGTESAGTEKVLVEGGTVDTINADDVTVDGGSVTTLSGGSVKVKGSVTTAAVDTLGTDVSGVVMDVTPATLYSGETSTVKVTVPSGYVLVDVIGDDGAVEMTVAGVTDTGAAKEYVYKFVMPKNDVTVKAVVEKADHAVTFMANGSVYKIVGVKNGDPVVAPANPAKAGHTFTKWMDELGNDVTFTDPIIADVTYIAEFTANSYNVNFEDALGNPQTMAVTYGASFTAPAALPGTEFLGWRGSDGKLYVAGDSYTYDVVGDLTLYPLYSYDTQYYMVYFYNADNSLYSVVLQNRATSNITLPAAPAPSTKWTRYDALGTAGADYLAGAVINDLNEGDYFVALAASAPSYAITTVTDPAGASVVTIDTTAQAGSVVDVNIAPYAGYVFDSITVVSAGGTACSVNTVSVGSLYQFVMPSDDVTVTVKFAPVAPDQCVVKFVVDGAVMDWKVVNQGDGVLLPSVPTKAGYTPDGWVEEGTTTPVYNSNTDFNGTNVAEVKLVAMYTPEAAVPHDITVVTTPGVTTLASADKTSATAGETVTVTVPDNTGYTFSSITVVGESGTACSVNTVAAGSKYQFTMPNEKVTVTVNYEPVAAGKCVVKFKVDGVMVDWQSVDQNTSITLPAVPAKAGAATGWWADGSSLYLGGAALPVGSATEIVLNAWYLMTDYSVTAEAKPDGVIATVGVSNTSVKAGETVTVTVPTVTGYVFDSITVTDEATGTKAFTVDMITKGASYQFTMPACNVKVTVNYTELAPKECVVKFVVDGAVMDWKVVKQGTSVLLPDIPAKTGFTANGWQVNGTGTVYAAGDPFDGTNTDEVVLVAKYTSAATQHSVRASAIPPTVGIVATNMPMAYAGETVTITVPTGGADYIFDYITVSGDSTHTAYTVNTISKGSQYQFTMPDENVTVLANYTAVPAGDCVLKFFVDGMLMDWRVVEQGTTATLPAVPAKEGKIAEGWVNGGNTYTTTFTDTDTAEVKFEAKYDDITYGITKTVDPVAYDGNVTVNTGAVAGELVDVNITEPFGYYFNGIVVIDESGNAVTVNMVSYGAHYQFVMPAKAVYVVVDFEAIPAEKCLVKFYVDGDMYHWVLVDQGALVTLPDPAPEKAGAVFKGWKYGANTYDVDFPAASAPEMVLNAVFETRSHIVTPVADPAAGGNVTVLYGTAKVGDLVDVTITENSGYYFDHLIVMGTSGTSYDINTVSMGSEYQFTMPDEDVQVIAHFEEIPPEKCIVKFYVDGELYDWLLVDQGAPVTPLPVEPTKLGYQFKGWKHGATVETGAFNAPDEDELILNAEFTPVYKNVSTDVTPTGLPDVVFVTTTAQPGKVVTVDVAAPAGYYFDGITVTGDVSGNSVTVNTLTRGAKYQFVMPDEAVTVHVNYKELPPEKCLVKFYVDSELYDWAVVDQNTSVAAPTDPVKAGATFLGWENGGTLYNMATIPVGAVSELNLNAKFNDITYTVNYNVKGGQPSAPADTGILNQTIVLPAAPTKDGSTFVGWLDPRTGFIYGENANYVVTGDVTLEAQWSANEYLVRFFNEDGTLAAFETKNYGDVIITPATAASVYGKTFAKWENTTDPTQTLNGGQALTVTQSADYKAVFTTNKWNVTYYGPNTTSNAARANVAVRDTVDFTVTADAGYVLTSVVLSYVHNGIAVNEELGTGGTYSFVMPDSDVTVTATTKQTVFNIALNSDLQTSIDLVKPTVGYEAEAGSSVRFTVTPDAGYSLSNVLVKDLSDGEERLVPVIATVQADGSLVYSFTMPEGDVEIITEAVQDQLVVTYVDWDNTLLGYETVGYNEKATATGIVTNRVGYTFKNWVSLPDLTDIDLTQKQITENVTFKASYVGNDGIVSAGMYNPDQIQIINAWVEGGSNSVLVDSNGAIATLTAKTGDTVYVKVAAKYNYKITDFAVNGVGGAAVTATFVKEEVSGGLTYRTYWFVMPAEDVLVDVYTQPIDYRVTVSETLNGALVEINTYGDFTINGDDTTNKMIAQSERVTIAVQPIAGYRVESIVATYNGVGGGFTPTINVDGSATLTFDMVPYDVEVVVNYTEVPHEVDVKTSNAITYPYSTQDVLDPVVQGYVVLEGVSNTTGDYMGTPYYTPDNADYVIGDVVEFSVEECTGYDLDTLAVTYAGGTKSCVVTKNGGSYFFTMPAEDVVITATFVPESHNVIKDDSDEANGTVTINTLRETVVAADYKQDVTVVVTPEPGYYVASIGYTLADPSRNDFSAASYTGAQTATGAQSITFKMPACDVELVVTYGKIDYAIDHVTSHCTVTHPASSTVGEQVTFTTAPDYGYIVSKVYAVNNTTGERLTLECASLNPTAGAVYQFTMPASAVTIHVETIKDEYNVYYLNQDGSVFGFENVKYQNEANIDTYTARLNALKPGYHFVGWTSVQCGVTTPSTTQSDFVITQQTYIQAVYEKDQIDVVFAASTNGTVNGSAASTTVHKQFGDTVNFEVVPDTGYEVDEVLITYLDDEGDEQELTYKVSGTTYTIKVPATNKATAQTVQASDVNVSVTFKKAQFNLSRNDTLCQTNGTLSINGKVTTQTSFHYDYNDAVEITAKPESGYYVTAVVATDLSGTKLYEALGTKPADNTVAGPAVTLNFNMPAEDVLFYVTYGKIDYTITTVADATQGAVTTDPAAKTTAGTVVTVTVTPKPGYKLDTLTVTYAGGKNSCVLTQTGANEFTFTMPVTADGVVVTATFTEVTYMVDLTATGEGVVTLNGYYTDNMPADYLDTVSVNVAPADGWRLVSITVDGGNVAINEVLNAAGGDYTFTMPSRDVEVKVVMEKTDYDLTSYAVNFFEQGHGTVTLSASTANVGDKIDIIANPDDGYRLKNVVVTDAAGNSVPVSFVSGDAYYEQLWSFTMPASAVNVLVIFEVYGSSYFTDVRTDHWFHEAVTFVADRGYFKGVSEDLFGPNILMNRAMFVTVLGRMEGIDPAAYTNVAFSDLEPGAYYTPYVAWASENGIVLGRDATTFDPSGNITRQEMVAIMYRYCKYLGMDVTPDHSDFMNRYTDVNQISNWALESVKWAVGEGIIRGRSATTIDPNGLANRAEVAQIVKNFCDKVLAP